MLGSGIAWYDVVGLLGVGAILAAYAMLQAGRWGARDLVYSVVNAMGAALVLVSLWYEFNLPAVVIELFWLAISGYGMWQAWRPAAARAPDQGR
jgi:hypothetical protein